MCSVILRALNETDTENLSRIANDKRISANLRDGFPNPYTIEDAKAFIAKFSKSDPQIVFAIEANREHVGNIGLHPKNDIYRKTAEIGYFIGVEYWGRGIATEAIGQMVNYGFEKLDLIRIEAGVFSHNPASMKVLEKAGFVKEGISEKVAIKNGVIIDEHRYAIINPKYK